MEFYINQARAFLINSDQARVFLMNSGSPDYILTSNRDCMDLSVQYYLLPRNCHPKAASPVPTASQRLPPTGCLDLSVQYKLPPKACQSNTSSQINTHCHPQTCSHRLPTRVSQSNINCHPQVATHRLPGFFSPIPTATHRMPNQLSARTSQSNINCHQQTEPQPAS